MRLDDRHEDHDSTIENQLPGWMFRAALASVLAFLSFLGNGVALMEPWWLISYDRAALCHSNHISCALKVRFGMYELCTTETTGAIVCSGDVQEALVCTETPRHLQVAAMVLQPAMGLGMMASLVYRDKEDPDNNFMWRFGLGAFCLGSLAASVLAGIALCLMFRHGLPCHHAYLLEQVHHAFGIAAMQAARPQVKFLIGPLATIFATVFNLCASCVAFPLHDHAKGNIDFILSDWFEPVHHHHHHEHLVMREKRESMYRQVPMDEPGGHKFAPPKDKLPLIGRFRQFWPPAEWDGFKSMNVNILIHDEDIEKDWGGFAEQRRGDIEEIKR